MTVTDNMPSWTSFSDRIKTLSAGANRPKEPESVVQQLSRVPHNLIGEFLVRLQSPGQRLRVGEHLLDLRSQRIIPQLKRQSNGGDHDLRTQSCLQMGRRFEKVSACNAFHAAPVTRFNVIVPHPSSVGHPGEYCQSVMDLRIWLLGSYSVHQSAQPSGTGLHKHARALRIGEGD